MNRLLLAAIAAFALTSVGCRHHNLASKGCSSCPGHVAEGCSNCGGQSGCNDCQGGGFAGGRVNWGGEGAGFAGLRNPQAVPRIPHSQYPGAIGPAGPQSAAVGYPYYTTRGPRDFLIDDPPSIGY